MLEILDDMGVGDGGNGGNGGNGVCNCLWGTPVVGADGSCTCTNPTANNVPNNADYNAFLVCPVGYEKRYTPGGRAYCAPLAVTTCPPGYILDNGVCRPSRVLQLGITTPPDSTGLFPTAPAPNVVEQLTQGVGTIFGMNPLVVLAAAGVGLYFLSSMAGGSESKRKVQ